MNYAQFQNETTQQLYDFIRRLSQLTLQQSICKDYINQLKSLEKTYSTSQINISKIKLIIVIKLQHQLLSLPIFPEHQKAVFLAEYQAILEIVKTQNMFQLTLWHYRALLSILDFKISIKHSVLTHKTFQDLLGSLEENFTIQQLLETDFICLEYFFLGLLLQFAARNEVEGYLQFYSILVIYIRDKLLKSQKKSQKKVQTTFKSFSNSTNKTLKMPTIKLIPQKTQKLSLSSKPNIITSTKLSQTQLKKQQKQSNKFLISSNEKLTKLTIQKASKSRQQLLQILLHIFLSFKLLQTLLKIDQFNLDIDIYSILYELDYSIIQKYSTEYKGYYTKDIDEAKNYIISQFRQLICKCQLNEFIELQKIIKQRPANITINVSNININSNLESKRFIFNKSRSCLQRIKSQHKISDNQFKFKMYMPKQITYNIQLQNSLLYKSLIQQKLLQRKKKEIASRANNKKISILNHLQSKKHTNQLDNRYKRYSSLNASSMSLVPNAQSLEKQMQELICKRPNNALSVDLLTMQEKTASGQAHSVKSAVKKIKRAYTRKNALKQASSNFVVKQNSQTQINNIFRFIKPMLINDVPKFCALSLEIYLKSLLTLIKYQQLQQQLPFSQQFVNLNKNIVYNFKGNFINFIQIQQKAYIYHLKYILNNKIILSSQINLLEINSQDYFVDKILLNKKIKKNNLFLFNFFGQNIYYFHIKVLFIPQKSSPNKPMKIFQIKDQNQHYSYTVYLNYETTVLKTRQKIIQKVQKAINKINKQIQIKYDYNKSYEFSQNFKKQSKKQYKLCQLFSKNHDIFEGNLIPLTTFNHALKIGTKILLFKFQLKKLISRNSYYLMIYNDAGNDIKTKRYRFILQCRDMDDLVREFNDIRSEFQLKKQFIKRNKLLLDEWNSVFLNRMIIKPHSKKYCFKKSNKFVLFQFFHLIENQFIIIYGQHNHKKWYLVLQLEQIKLKSKNRKMFNILKQIHTSIKKIAITPYNNRKSFANFSSKKLIRQNHVIQNSIIKQLKQSKQQNDMIHIMDDWFKISYYQYSWLKYNKDKTLSYYYKINQNINKYHIQSNQFISIKSYKLQQLSQMRNRSRSRGEVYNEVVEMEERKISNIQFVFYKLNILVKIECRDGDRVVCCFFYEEKMYEIFIMRKQLFSFHFQLPLTGKLIKKELIKQRIFKLAKNKINQLNLQDFY